MTKNEILTELYLSKEVDKIIKSFNVGAYKDDLMGELYLILCEMPAKKLIEAYDGKYLIYLIVNILTKQFKSTTSPFYKKYRQGDVEFIDQYITPDLVAEEYAEEDTLSPLVSKFKAEENILSILQTYLKEIKEEDAIIFKMYYKLGEYNIIDGAKRDLECKKPTSTFRRMSKLLSIPSSKGEYKLSPTTVFNSVKATMIGLQDRLDSLGIKSDLRWEE